MPVRIEDALRPWVERHGWEPGADAYERLEVLVELWERYGAAMNLHGARTREDLVRHVQDGLETALCATRAAEISRDTAWLDVGSGGGFPALVVATVLPCAMTCLEPREKRAAFLELAFCAIERESSRVIRGRLERFTWRRNSVDGISSSGREWFSVATARAVFEPAVWLDSGSNVVGRPATLIIHGDPPHEARPPPVVTVAGTFSRIVAYRFT